jgi:hypothetical protein
MDINSKMKSSLGNAKDLENAAEDRVTGIKTSDLRVNDKPAAPRKRERDPRRRNERKS